MKTILFPIFYLFLLLTCTSKFKQGKDQPESAKFKGCYKDFDFSLMKGVNELTPKDTNVSFLKVHKKNGNIIILVHLFNKFKKKYSNRIDTIFFVKKKDYYERVIKGEEEFGVFNVYKEYLYKNHIIIYHYSCDKNRDNKYTLIGVTRLTNKYVQNIGFRGIDIKRLVETPYLNYDSLYAQADGYKGATLFYARDKKLKVTKTESDSIVKVYELNLCNKEEFKTIFTYPCEHSFFFDVYLFGGTIFEN